MIRVLQTGMTDNLGGIENFLINYYRNINKDKIQFDFINIYPNKLCFQQEIEELGGKVYNVPNYYKHPIKYLKAVKKIIEDNNYRIVHCNMNSAVFLYPLIASKLAKAKIIIAHAHNSSNDKGILKSFLHNLNRYFIPLFANTYFACSDYAGEWFFTDKIIKSNKFHIINNSIDFEKFEFNKKIRENKRKELGIHDDTILLGHVGRFNKQKNHKYILDLLNELKIRNKKREYKLLLIGIGPTQEYIRNRVSELNLIDSVIFLNQRSDVNELMQAMDIFVLPSLYEGLPLVGIEAQISGLLCLFSDRITKTLKISEGAYFIPLEKKEKYINLIEKYDFKRFNGFTNSFEIKESSSNLLDLYYSLINKGGKKI